MQTIGWIGAGRMGLELATRLLRAGYDLAVWNRTRAKAEPLVALGARIVDTPAALADCDAVVTMVASDEVLEHVTLADDGLFSGDRAPEVLIDSSTVSEAASERVRAAAGDRKCTLLVAPVSGNPKVVRSGRLSVVVSGPHEAYDRAAVLLSHFGAHVSYVGEGDRARLVKICHNLLLGVTAQTLAETAVLAERGGISRADYLGFINDSVMGSMFSRYKTPALVGLDYTPTFTSHLLRKDFELGLQAARDLDVTLPVSALVHQLVVALSNGDHGDADFAALLSQQAAEAGVELTAEDADVSDGLGDPDAETG
jgi:3-hydroxyisobutyrate dehydrogenase